MNINKNLFISIFSLTLTASVFAQDAEEIVVTGIRANEYNELPAVTFSKKADFLVQRVELINDSRAPDLRKNEILQTIKNLISAAKKIHGIELSYGEGFLTPINLDDESLRILDDKKASDTSHIRISIKIAIAEKESAKLKIEELKKFLKGANLVGRTEIENQGDIGLSIVNPEQYRPEILALIAKENSKLKEALGTNCYTENDGLSGRVEWDRTAVDELVLYIRHATKVVCK